MKLVFLGPPGAGKGTLAAMFAEKHGYTHLSTGEMLRAAIAADTTLGKRAAAYVNAGQLVPQEILGEVVKERLTGLANFILDGYPRTLEQAVYLATIATLKLDAVVYVDVSEAEAVKRLANRRVCKSCGNVVGARYQEPDCDRCRGELVTREDDTPETVVVRYNVYREHTAPLIGYYRERHLLLEIDGSGSPDDVVARLEGALTGPAPAA